jgi:hypothetical protein
MPMPLAFARRHEVSLASLRRTLGDADFQVEWEAGRTLEADEVLRSWNL